MRSGRLSTAYSIASLAIAFLAPLIPGSSAPPYELDLPRLFSHLAYLSSILDYNWYNVVYWTLAIELQFYLCIALLVPLLVHGRFLRKGNNDRLRYSAFPSFQHRKISCPNICPCSYWAFARFSYMRICDLQNLAAIFCSNNLFLIHDDGADSDCGGTHRRARHCSLERL